MSDYSGYDCGESYNGGCSGGGCSPLMLALVIILMAILGGAMLPAKNQTTTTTTTTENNLLSKNKVLSENQINLFSEVTNYFIEGQGAKGVETTSTTVENTTTTTNQANTEVTGDRNQLIPGTNYPMRAVFNDGIERCWNGSTYTEEACKTLP